MGWNIERFVSFASVCLFFIGMPSADAAEAWVLQDSSADLRVYSRATPGSGMDTIKASIQLEHPAESVAAVLTDISQQHTFVPHMRSIEVLKKTTLADGKFRQLIYQVNSLPIIDDRDVVLSSLTWDETVKGLRIWKSTFKAITDKGPPPRDDMVRIEKMVGAWTVRERVPGRSCTVTYITHTEVGGMIPDILAREGQLSALADLLLALQKRVATQAPPN